MKDFRFLLVIPTLVLLIVVVFLSWIGLDLSGNVSSTGLRNHEATLPAMLDGTAERPFVGRFLVPALASAFVTALPDAAVDRVTRTLWRNDICRHYAQVMEWPRETLAGCLAALALALLSLAAFAWGISDLARWASLGAGLPSLLAVAILPIFFREGAHCIYDLPALAFSTLSLCALRRGSLGAYYVLLGVGLMNKETQVLAFAPLLVQQVRARASAYTLTGHTLAHVFGLAALWCARLRLFGENPGASMEFHLVANVNRFLEAFSVDQLAVLALLAYLLTIGTRRAPRLLADALWMVPPLTLLYLVGGVWGEIRVLLEAFPAVYLVGCCAFQRERVRETASVQPA